MSTTTYQGCVGDCRVTGESCICKTCEHCCHRVSYLSLHVVNKGRGSDKRYRAPICSDCVFSNRISALTSQTAKQFLHAYQKARTAGKLVLLGETSTGCEPEQQQKKKDGYLYVRYIPGKF
jgi:hypothetical protein